MIMQRDELITRTKQINLHLIREWMTVLVAQLECKVVDFLTWIYSSPLWKTEWWPALWALFITSWSDLFLATWAAERSIGCLFWCVRELIYARERTEWCSELYRNLAMIWRACLMTLWGPYQFNGQPQLWCQAYWNAWLLGSFWPCHMGR